MCHSELDSGSNNAGYSPSSGLRPPYPTTGKQGRYAFTLAEVLITLGIIGVVAAMTMPTLIAMHRKSAVEAAVKKFYTNMNQAIKLSEVEYGDRQGWTFPDDNSQEGLKNWYDIYLAKNLITLDEKFEIGIGTDGQEKSALILYFPDGSIDMITYRGHDHYFCTNGSKFKKSLNANNGEVDKELGRNCFLFGFYPAYVNPGSKCAVENYDNKGLEPYINGLFNCDDYGDIPKMLDAGFYSKILQLNGWYFPKDYPIKF